MADLPSVEAYLEGQSPDGIATFWRFEEMVHPCGPSEPYEDVGPGFRGR